MNLKYGVFLGCALASLPTFAFNCYFTLAKDRCWGNYNVTVDVYDAHENKFLIRAQVPKGKSWVRESFTCEPGQRLIYHAKYEPIFWLSEKGKTYTALRYWSLPTEIKENQSAWEIPVCFPDAFAAVPLPPEADSNCHCDFKSIPPIKIQ